MKSLVKGAENESNNHSTQCLMTVDDHCPVGKNNYPVFLIHILTEE